MQSEMKAVRCSVLSNNSLFVCLFFHRKRPASHRPRTQGASAFTSCAAREQRYHLAHGQCQETLSEWRDSTSTRISLLMHCGSHRRERMFNCSTIEREAWLHGVLTSRRFTKKSWDTPEFLALCFSTRHSCSCFNAYAHTGRLFFVIHHCLPVIFSFLASPTWRSHTCAQFA